MINFLLFLSDNWYSIRQNIEGKNTVRDCVRRYGTLPDFGGAESIKMASKTAQANISTCTAQKYTRMARKEVSVEKKRISSHPQICFHCWRNFSILRLLSVVIIIDFLARKTRAYKSWRLTGRMVFLRTWCWVVESHAKTRQAETKVQLSACPILIWTEEKMTDQGRSFRWARKDQVSARFSYHGWCNLQHRTSRF